MLRIKRIQLCGFKSFSERTEVDLPSGITAVVGPNGCGKSNIGDAINWVLGEQSAKMLRGKQMADVIFNGSAARKPTGFAEVSLHLTGVGGAADTETALTRRLFRTGESEYLIDGKRSRLKDIEQLLREERVGAKTYATIEQGRIDQILNAKPKERRLVIEEAAGVAGFKHKRRLTELKLDATRANLLRVNDIITEVQRQINSLKRQAAKARRYQRLRDELRERQGLRFARVGRAMDAKIEELRAREASAKDAEAAGAAGLSAEERAIEEERTRLERDQAAYRESGERLHALDLEIDRADAQIRVLGEKVAESNAAADRLVEESRALADRRGELRQRAEDRKTHVAEQEAALAGFARQQADHQRTLEELDARSERVRGEVEEARRLLFETVNLVSELRNRRTTVAETAERNAQRHNRVRDELHAARSDRSRLVEETTELRDEAGRYQRTAEELEREAGDLARELEAVRADHDACVERLAAGRTQERSLAARLSTLEDISNRFAGVSDGVRALLSKGTRSGIRTGGVVADYVAAGRDVESAAEAYLQPFLPAVIVETDDDARRAVAFLRAEGAGRTAVVSKAQPAGHVAVGSPGNGAGSGSAVPQALLDDPRVLGRLRDRLKMNTALNGVVQSRIGDAVLVDSLESALLLHRQHPALDYLTREGEVVYASGLVVAGGAATSENGLLAHTRQIAEVRVEAAGAAELVTALTAEERQLRGRHDGLAAKLAERRERLEQLRHRGLELNLRVERSAEESRRSERQTEMLDDELAVLEKEAASLTDEAARCEERLQRAEQRHQETESKLESSAAELEELERRRRDAAEQGARAREAVAEHTQRLEAARAELERLIEAGREAAARIEQIGAEREALLQRAESAGQERRENESGLLRAHEQRERLLGEHRTLDRRIAESREALQRREQGIGGRRRQLDAQRNESHAAEMERVRAESDREHLSATCQEELGLSPAQLAENLGAEALDEADVEQLEQQIDEVRAKLERIGPVNILAIDEFSELEERNAFLTAQREDLEKSMASLQETIRRINRQSRERFTNAFEAIRRNFQEIFAMLFNGGRADLRLEEGEDVLECGIEIMAQPPGKRLTSVQLLSGGEKAMSAIALLFAIFRFRPSPFCLLDEVDAPLDDVNIGRFTRMLREYAAQTQFILVTHNKLSMEAADSLYGVTMPEPGVSRLMSMELQ